MDEFELIKSIKQKTYYQKSLIKGIDDDAAIFQPSGYDVVTAMDTFVQDIHFSHKTTSYFQVGYRALAANISDMAAMGAYPKFYLVSIVIPANMSEQQIFDIYKGMKALASKFKMDLIGGDTVSGKQLTISISIIGYVEKGKARYRHLAKHNDIVFVTGTLGGSRAGLYVLLNDLPTENNEELIKKHQLPNPRVLFSTSLKKIERMSLNDISDGIANELYEIAEASNVTITIDDKLIPIHPQLSQFPLEKQTEWKYFGGEDFELVGTVSPNDWPYIQQRAKEIRLQVTEIGKVTYNKDSNGQVYVIKNNQKHLLNKGGYVHLK